LLLELPVAAPDSGFWLLQYGSEAIRYRNLPELAPDGLRPPQKWSKRPGPLSLPPRQPSPFAKKQKDTGVWA